MLNTLLLSELTKFLSYDKYDVSGYNTGNSRNGYYERSLHTIFGNITIKIPCDRLEHFQNKIDFIYYCFIQFLKSRVAF